MSHSPDPMNPPQEQMDTIKHTPLPFKLTQVHTPDSDFGNPYFEIKGGIGSYHRVLSEHAPDTGGCGFNLSGILSKHDAKFIVEACNSHYKYRDKIRALTSALEKATAALTRAKAKS